MACCSSGPDPCDEAQVPYQARPTTSEELMKVVRYGIRHECSDVLHDATSELTQSKIISAAAMLPALDGRRIPAPWNYKLIDVIRDGEFVAALSKAPKREFAYISYQEPGKPELLAQILVLEETIDGKPVMRLGFQEQIDEEIPYVQPPADDDPAPPADGRSPPK